MKAHLKMLSKSKPYAISLFSGMGGGSLGMERAGFEVIAHSEIDQVSQQSHKINFPNCKLIGTGDLSKTTDDELASFAEAKVDLIFAGFYNQKSASASEDPKSIED